MEINLKEMKDMENWTGGLHLNQFGDLFIEIDCGDNLFSWDMIHQGKASVENGELRNALHKAETKIISLKKGR